MNLLYQATLFFLLGNIAAYVIGLGLFLLLSPDVDQ